MTPRHLLACCLLALAPALPLAAQNQLFPQETYEYEVAPNTTVRFTQVKFKAPGNAKVTVEEQDGKAITLIDGQRAFGNDHGQLYELLNTGVIIMQDEPVPLETTFMFNPRLGAQMQLPVEVRQSKSAYYVIATFGYAENTYYAVWRIRDSKSERVLLTDDREQVKEYL